MRAVATALHRVLVGALLLAPGLVPATAAAEGTTLAEGRGLTWGVGLVAPIFLGDVRETSGRAIDYINPGGGVEARVGYELPGGFAIGLVGGVSALASENSRAPAFYRAAVEGRWVVDTGSIVSPALSLAAGLLLAELDQGMVATAYGRAQAGVQLAFEPWVALELALGVEGAPPLDAFGDALFWLAPQVGVSFYW